jgi:hypothetical protein
MLHVLQRCSYGTGRTVSKRSPYGWIAILVRRKQAKIWSKLTGVTPAGHDVSYRTSRISRPVLLCQILSLSEGFQLCGVLLGNEDTATTAQKSYYSVKSSKVVMLTSLVCKVGRIRHTPCCALSEASTARCQHRAWQLVACKYDAEYVEHP